MFAFGSIIPRGISTLRTNPITLHLNANISDGLSRRVLRSASVVAGVAEKKLAESECALGVYETETWTVDKSNLSEDNLKLLGSTGRWSFSQLMVGSGTPSALQKRSREVPTDAKMVFSVESEMIRGGDCT